MSNQTVLVNNTGQDIAMFRNYFLAYPQTKALPKEIADLFAVELHTAPGGEVHICVDMADD